MPDHIDWLHSEMIKTLVAHGHTPPAPAPRPTSANSATNYVSDPERRDIPDDEGRTIAFGLVNFRHHRFRCLLYAGKHDQTPPTHDPSMKRGEPPIVTLTLRNDLATVRGSVAHWEVDS